MVLDKPKKNDNVYPFEGFKIIINQEEEVGVNYLDIDYIEDWSGKGCVITAGF